MKRLLLTLAALALVLSAAPLFAETEVEQAPITWQQAALADGEALYAELCASCHGLAGKGDGPAAPALKVQLSDLTLLAAANGGEFPADRVERAITGGLGVAAHGSAEMPVWGKVFESLKPGQKPVQRWDFARTRIYNLTEYLREMQVEE